MLNENFSLGRLHKKSGEIPGDCPPKISPRSFLTSKNLDKRRGFKAQAETKYRSNLMVVRILTRPVTQKSPLDLIYLLIEAGAIINHHIIIHHSRQQHIEAVLRHL